MEIEPTAQKLKTTPRDFFLHLGIMAALYVSAVSIINLLFQTINYAFPDLLAYYGDPYSTGIRLAIASLIIIFPLFLLLARLAAREFAVSPEKRELTFRRFLSYLTLFVAGVAVVVDLVALVNTFLGGEITVRFALKVLSVLLVAGGVFSYFFYDLRQKEPAARKDTVFAWAAIVAVIASIVWGFAIMGSPMTARAMRFDARRVSDLQSIQRQIVNFWQQKGRLPAQLSDVEDSVSGRRIPEDPAEALRYEYSAGEKTAFKLCATFSRSTVGDAERLKGRGAFGYGGPYSSRPVYDGYGSADNWEHEKGYFCFDRTIDPELYPVKPKYLP